jgi:hypothetical protein
MSAARVIRDQMSRPGPAAYFAVASFAALLVLAVAGFIAQQVAVAELDGASAHLESARTGLGGPEAVLGTSRAEYHGEIQRVLLDAQADAPQRLVVRAGVPLEVRYAGSASTVPVLFQDDTLGEAVVLRQGETLVPALAPGSYRFSCPSAGVTGVLVAE